MKTFNDYIGGKRGPIRPKKPAVREWIVGSNKQNGTADWMTDGSYFIKNEIARTRYPALAYIPEGVGRIYLDGSNPIGAPRPNIKTIIPEGLNEEIFTGLTVDLLVNPSLILTDEHNTFYVYLPKTIMQEIAHFLGKDNKYSEGVRVRTKRPEKPNDYSLVVFQLEGEAFAGVMPMQLKNEPLNYLKTN